MFIVKRSIRVDLKNMVELVFLSYSVIGEVQMSPVNLFQCHFMFTLLVN